MTGQKDERWYKNDRADGIKMTPNKDKSVFIKIFGYSIN